ncbi:MAG: GNAT family N-acetyltransferase [Sphingomonadaceae bacterium]
MEQARIDPGGANRAADPLPRVRVAAADDPRSWPSDQAWDDLVRDASTPNPFFERWFLAPGLRHLGGTANVALALVELEGALVGLLPVARKRRYYSHPLPHLAAWLHDNAFCGTPLVRRGLEGLFWQALLHWADRHAGAALFLHLPHLPADGQVHGALVETLRRTRRPAAVVQRSERALLQSGHGPEQYFTESMSAKKRKELRRQHNRLAEQGTLAFDRAEGADGLERWTDDYLALEAKGWKGGDGSALAQHPANAALFRDALGGAAQAQRLERLTLRLDGRPIAMLANFLTPPGAFSFKTTYDEDYARFSPGVLLQRENLDLLARPDIAWADSCAAADHPMIERIWREKRNLVRISIAIGGVARRSLANRIFKAEARTIPQEF